MAGRIADSRTVYFCLGELDFEWDAGKAERNLAKHGVSFEEAAGAIVDPRAREISDPLHSIEEERTISRGYGPSGVLLVVVSTERESRIRIISARRATAWERREHEEAH